MKPIFFLFPSVTCIHPCLKQSDLEKSPQSDSLYCTMYIVQVYSILSFVKGRPHLHVFRNFNQMIIILSESVHLKLESSGMLAIIGIAAMLLCLG